MSQPQPRGQGTERGRQPAPRPSDRQPPAPAEVAVITPLHVGGITACAMVAALGLAGDIGRHLQAGTSLTGDFLASWHLVLYGGVTALVLWLGGLAVAHGPAAMRSVYGPSAVGAIALALAGLADFAWHEVFGFEVGLAALLSPPHLGLLVGLMVVFAGPLNALWRRPGADLTGWEATVVVVCVTGAVSVLMLFTGYLSLFSADVIVSGMRNPMVGTRSTPDQVIQGIATVLWTSLVLTAPWLALRLRWRLRPGMITASLVIVAVGAYLAVPGLAEEALWATVIAAIVVDGLVTVVAGGSRASTSVVLTAPLLPLVLWSTTFRLLARNGALVWDEALWMGAIVLAVLETTSLAGLLIFASRAARIEPPPRSPTPPASSAPVRDDAPGPDRAGPPPMRRDRPPPGRREPARSRKEAPSPSSRHREPSPFRLDGPAPELPRLRPRPERPPGTPPRQPPPQQRPPGSAPDREP